jgi:hypothetical protein
MAVIKVAGRCQAAVPVASVQEAASAQSGSSTQRSSGNAFQIILSRRQRPGGGVPAAFVQAVASVQDPVSEMMGAISIWFWTSGSS